jgi:collagen beta-1,O-galactosyltransferase
MLQIRPYCLSYTLTSSLGIEIDGSILAKTDLSDYGLFKWRIESRNHWWNRPLKAGEIGCAIAHATSWADAFNKNSEFCIILEDDICFSESFCEQVDSALRRLSTELWDILYLGRLPLESDKGDLDFLSIPGYSHCSYGYILSRTGIQKALDTDLLSDIIPIDEFLPAMYMDHPRRDVAARYRRCMNAFSFNPCIVEQLPKDMAGSDTESSEYSLS